MRPSWFSIFHAILLHVENLSCWIGIVEHETTWLKKWNPWTYVHFLHDSILHLSSCSVCGDTTINISISYTFQCNLFALWVCGLDWIEWIVFFFYLLQLQFETAIIELKERNCIGRSETNASQFTFQHSFICVKISLRVNLTLFHWTFVFHAHTIYLEL